MGMFGLETLSIPMTVRESVESANTALFSLKLTEYSPLWSIHEIIEKEVKLRRYASEHVAMASHKSATGDRRGQFRHKYRLAGMRGMKWDFMKLVIFEKKIHYTSVAE
eukprot:TRINITY_DN2715_c0_g1::TRINITY_DN2715_c0_g1_i2::g.27321::m.27321 TRINITY_DN2715_c0_g1::TRINITY_DN2715_c0_g1_i2::g.27321  ORF type:complete len:108 (-),score=8.45,DUF4491/PF14898.1/0.094 TRINITY_DN2715_c0_g1_i2:225-548(-)